MRIALRDILFELGELKTRHDHDLHELKAMVKRREAENRRLTDVLHLLRDLEANLNALPPSVTRDDSNECIGEGIGTSCGGMNTRSES